MARFTITELRRRRPAARFSSNEKILGSWHEWTEGRLARHTAEQYLYQNRMFCEAFGSILVTDLTDEDIQDYIDLYEARSCRWYRNGNSDRFPEKCLKDQDLSSCPVLVEGATCAARQPLKSGTVERHLNAMRSLYRFLHVRKHVPFNPVDAVREAWREDHRHVRDRSERRSLTPTELRALFSTRRPQVRFLFILLYKTGLRIEEAQRLLLSKVHLDQGYLEIPCRENSKRCRAQTHHKHWAIIDDDLRLHLIAYLRWRSLRADPAEDHLIVGESGQAPGYKTLLRRWLRPELERLGLWSRPGEDGSNVVFHMFRHTFHTELRRNGCDSGWTEVLRGCRPPGNDDTYNDYDLETLRRVYLAHRPRMP